MDSPARKDVRTSSNAPSPADIPGGAELDVDAEELQFFREVAKISRRTTAKELDRLFGPAE